MTNDFDGSIFNLGYDPNDFDSVRDTVLELLEENRKLSYWLGISLSALQLNHQIIAKSLTKRLSGVPVHDRDSVEPLGELELTALLQTISLYVQPCKEFTDSPYTALIEADYDSRLTKLKLQEAKKTNKSE